MVWTSANGPKCPVSPEDRGEAPPPDAGLREALEKIKAMFTVQKRTGVAGLDGSICVGEIYEIANAALALSRPKLGGAA